MPLDTSNDSPQKSRKFPTRTTDNRIKPFFGFYAPTWVTMQLIKPRRKQLSI